MIGNYLFSYAENPKNQKHLKKTRKSENPKNLKNLKDLKNHDFPLAFFVSVGLKRPLRSL